MKFLNRFTDLGKLQEHYQSGMTLPSQARMFRHAIRSSAWSRPLSTVLRGQRLDRIDHVLAFDSAIDVVEWQGSS